MPKPSQRLTLKPVEGGVSLKKVAQALAVCWWHRLSPGLLDES